MMHLVACSVLLTHLAKVQAQQYELIRSYTPENFFDEFEFFTGADPTGGFVQFVPYETAAVSGLVDNSSNQIHLGVDHVNNYVAGGLGRQSVRVQSKMAFTEGLFIADLLHIPTGCGTWPAFWTVGLGDWPTDGEIDIVENVNDATSNNAALHAAGDCAVNPLSGQTGTWKSTDCNIAHDGNQGCGTNFTEPNNYGLDFNANGGGIYAMEWTKSFINIWFFPPENIPQSLNSTSFMSPDIRPDPDTFGPPSASFWGPCSASFGDKFFNHSIVFDTTFCGGWAGNTFGTGGSQCPLLAGATPLESCVNYVANSPQSFTDAYWSIRSLTVWQKVPNFAPQFNANFSNPAFGGDAASPSAEVSEVQLPVPPGQGGTAISPLTGGILTSGEGPIQIFPTVPDTGLADGALLGDSAHIAAPPPPQVWNTEGSAIAVPAPVPSPPTTDGIVTVDDSTPSGLQSVPVIASLWDVLQADAQAQLLELAKQLDASASATSDTPPILPIIEQAPVIAPAPSTQLESTTPISSSLFESTNPTSPSQQLSTIAAPLTASAVDASTVLGDVFGLLEPASRDQLLALAYGPGLSTPERTRVRRGRREPEWCNDQYYKHKPTVGSKAWLIKFARQYYIFLQLLQSVSVEERKLIIGFILGDLGNVNFRVDCACEGKTSVGSPAWLRDFARNLRSFQELLSTLSPQDQEEVSRFVLGYVQNGSRYKRSISLTGTLDSRWDGLSESTKEKLRSFGTQIEAVILEHESDEKTDDEYVQSLLGAVKDLYRASSFKEKLQVLSLITAADDRARLRNAFKAAALKKRDDEEDSWDDVDELWTDWLDDRLDRWRHYKKGHWNNDDDDNDEDDDSDPWGRSRGIMRGPITQDKPQPISKPETSPEAKKPSESKPVVPPAIQVLPPPSKPEEHPAAGKNATVNSAASPAPAPVTEPAAGQNSEAANGSHEKTEDKGGPKEEEEPEEEEPSHRPNHRPHRRPGHRPEHPPDEEAERRPHRRPGHRHKGKGAKPKERPSYFDQLDDEDQVPPGAAFEGVDTDSTADFAEVAHADGYPWSKGPKRPGDSAFAKTPQSASKKITTQYNDLALWDSLPKGAKEGILDAQAASPDDEYFNDKDHSWRLKRRQWDEGSEGSGSSDREQSGESGGDWSASEDEEEPSSEEIVDSLRAVALQLQDIIDKYLSVESIPTHADENASSDNEEGGGSFGGGWDRNDRFADEPPTWRADVDDWSGSNQEFW